MSKNKKTKVCHIDIGKDFAKSLGTRLKKNSENSGEEFFETLLEPAFNTYDKVVIHLDSLTGYSAGFLEESFGGLVRKYGHEKVTAKIRFEGTKRAYLIPEILKWMAEAKQK